MTQIHICFDYLSLCFTYFYISLFDIYSYFVLKFSLVLTKLIRVLNYNYKVFHSFYSYVTNARICSLRLISYLVISDRVIVIKKILSQELGCSLHFNFIHLFFESMQITNLPHKTDVSIKHGQNTVEFVPNFDKNHSKVSLLKEPKVMSSLKNSTNNNKFKVTVKPNSIGIDTGAPDQPNSFGTDPSKGDSIQSNKGNDINKTKASNDANVNKHSNKRASTYRGNSGKFNHPNNKVESFCVDEGSFESDTTPLYLMNGNFFTFSETKSFSEEEFENVFFKYQFALQDKSQYDISRNVDKSKFILFIKCLVESLEIYFFLTSVINYVDENIRGNRGLIHIRDKIGADDLYDLNSLKNLLESMYMNPNLVNFMKFMYGNYCVNTSKFSPIIKLCPSNLFLNDLNNNSVFRQGITIKNKIKELRDYYYMSSIFRKLNSDWKIDLSSFDTSQKFDCNFLGFWHNCTINYAGLKERQGITTSRIVDGLKSDIYIGLFSDSTKGQCVASIAVRELKSGIFETGIYVPTKDYPDILDYENRISLHVYNPFLGIIGIRSVNDAVMSFIYATPFINSNGSQEVFINKYQSKEVLSPSLLMLRKFVHQTIQFLFLS